MEWLLRPSKFRKGGAAMERISKISKTLVVVAMLAVAMVSAAGCHHFYNRHFGGFVDRYDRR
jgi:hypothetical protein